MFPEKHVKKICSFLVILLALSQLFASTYRIRSYSFESKKTTKGVLSEFVGAPGATFETKEDLDAFLADKRQQLYNKRIFLEVLFTYELTETSPDVFDADVVFHISDAKTFLIVPFPKYDSNYGLSLKLKAKDTNFLGTFTTLDANLEYTQRNNSFDEGQLDWDLTVDALRIKDAKLSFSQYGGLNYQNWYNSNAGFSADVSNVKIGSVGLSGSLAFNLGPEGYERTDNWSLRNIEAVLGTSVDFTGVGLSNTVKFKMVPKSNSEFYILTPESISDSASLSFKNPRLKGATLGTTISYNFFSKLFKTDSVFSFKYEELFGITAKVYLYTEQTGFVDGLSLIRPGIGASKSFSLFGKIAFTPSLDVYLPYRFTSKSLDLYVVTTLPFSYGRIDWVDNNFRKGFTFSLSATDTYYIFSGYNKISASGSAAVHYPVASWFNPSARLNFMFSNELLDINKDNVYSWNMRGIRDDNGKINLNRTFGMTFNLDLMLNFIRIEDFCSTYAVPFMDLFLGSNADGSIEKLVTVGAEGIIILDSHPSYPIRGSLGFNALDLASWSRGELDFNEVEFELFIGLYFLY